ncbi:MAG: AAA family ATPase [Alphaproteobacteria bacterium]|nr:AAA family ATPase [Alphaproteobacteria bacterium]
MGPCAGLGGADRRACAIAHAFVWIASRQWRAAQIGRAACKPAALLASSVDLRATRCQRRTASISGPTPPMPGKVISIANMKGGVGKTTITVGLAHAFAGENAAAKAMRILVIDLDAQANASFWFCGDQKLTELIESGRTMDAFLEDAVVLNQKRSLSDYAHVLARASARGDLAVIPCSPELRLIEREMTYFLSERRASLKEVENVVAELLVSELGALKEKYDLIIFDTAPGISALTEAALRASDVVIVPTVPDFISNLGLEAFCRSVWWANHSGSELQRTPWVAANMVKDTKHHAAMLAEMRAESQAEDAGFKMFRIEIPCSEEIEEAGARVREAEGAAAAAFDPGASLLFAAFAKEIADIINVPAPLTEPR